MIWTVILKNGNKQVITGDRHSMDECYRILRTRGVNYDEVAAIIQGRHETVPFEKNGFTR